MNKIVIFLAIIMSLCMKVQGLTTYVDRFDYKGYLAVHQLGYLLANYTLRINLTTADYSDGFGFDDAVLLVLSDQTIPSPLTDCENNCAVSPLDCALICNINTSNYYRFSVSLEPIFFPIKPPSHRRLQTMQLQASYYLTFPQQASFALSPPAITIFKRTQVFRSRLYKLIYIDSLKEVTFALTPAFPNFPSLFTNRILMFNVTSISEDKNFYDYTTSNPLTLFPTDYEPNLSNATYTMVLSPGYYVMAVSYLINPDFYFFPNIVRVIYQSDPYPCPYNSQYIDYYNTFQPCSGQGAAPSLPGFPCLAYNNVTKQCTTCIYGYELIDGKCQYNTSCPQGKYFHFGECLPVSLDCQTIDPFTGYCLTCVINASQIVNGKCIANTVVCADRQYVKNNTCFNVSALCLAFSNQTGGCLSCIQGYQLTAEGTCIRSVVICPQNQYLAPDNFTCKNYPANCPSFDTFNEVCRTCARGFYLSEGICQQILCPPRQVPSVYGLFCVKVSELCKDYDTLTGDCLTCTISNYFVSNGRCVEAISPLAGCQERESLGFGECLNAEVNCLSYNLQTQNCDKCVNGFFKDFTGRCTLQNTVCQSDEVSIQGICVQMPRDCAQVDGLGLCVRCIDPLLYRIVSGQCIFTPVCTSRQYRSETGECINVSGECLTFNPSTGACITCTGNIQAQQGLCCPAGYAALNKQCVDAITYRNSLNSAQGNILPTCIAFHPSLGICLACNGNFQVNPVTQNTCY